MNERIVYTVAEACARAGIRRTSLYKAIGAGKLRAIKNGRRTLILADDLRRWLFEMPALVPDQGCPDQTASEASVVVHEPSEAGPHRTDKKTHHAPSERCRNASEAADTVSQDPADRAAA
jgi:excisionase family DNA binding protein